ncbi:hypothetical protein LTR95_015219 [Oleoguttula sp. CCFEE 5521]
MHNTQYIAHSQIFHSPERDASRDFLDALFVTNPAIDRDRLERLKGKTTEGACTWIKEHPSFRSWQSGGPRLLHVRGGPGKGKTMLCLYLTSALACRAGAIMMYYFFSAADSQLNNAAVMMRGLIWQFITLAGITQVVERVLARYTSREQILDLIREPETMWKILIELLGEQSHKTVYFVVDGLDECIDEDRKWVVKKFLSSATADGPTALRTLLFSRPLLDLRDAHHIDLDDVASPASSSDVEQYISASVVEMVKRYGMGEDKAMALKSELSRRAQNTFLWVGFATAECAKKDTYMEVLYTLQTLPRGLFGIYGRILSNIPDGYNPTVVHILQWIALAERPLHLAEFAYLLNPEAVDAKESVETTCDYIRLCGSMLQVVEAEIDADPWDWTKDHSPRLLSVTQVILVHESARDYLLATGQNADERPASYRWNIEEAHAQLAEACITAMEVDCRPYREDISEHILECAETSALLQPGDLTVLHAAVMHSDAALVIRVIECGADLNAKRYTDGSTPLHLAVRRCYYEDEDSKTMEVIRVLLRYHPMLDISDDHGLNAFDLAAERDLESAGQLLGAHDPDPATLQRRWVHAKARSLRRLWSAGLKSVQEKRERIAAEETTLANDTHSEVSGDDWQSEDHRDSGENVIENEWDDWEESDWDEWLSQEISDNKSTARRLFRHFEDDNVLAVKEGQ